MDKKRILLVVAILSVGFVSFSQSLNQNIKGQVIDKQSQTPLPGATVVVVNSDPLMGTVSDTDGYYSLENVEIGRVSLLISFVGYEPVSVNNVILNSGKELILNIELEESVSSIEAVTIKYKKDKTKPCNEMASISARTFSIEETSKYAGSWNDIARMASNFAGVRGADDSNNDIIIRGNSPVGLLWRLEGVDIPNPNHFGNFGATGGPISMLNNNVLSNSDFFSGAFPAEYGNSYSGVFDLSMRAGNYENHEFTGQLGLNGIELGAEGPIFKSTHSSYLVNYRYAMLDVVNTMFDLGTGSSLPSFQDLSFKLNFPSRKIGRITLFGLGGTSKIKMIVSDDEEKENFYTFGDYPRDTYFSANTGIVGASHTYLINSTTYTKVILAATSKYNQNADDSISVDDKTRIPVFRRNFTDSQLSVRAYVNKKINQKHNFQTGIQAKIFNLNLTDSVYAVSLQQFVNLTNTQGSTNLMQYYLQWQYKPTNSITINTGANSQLFTLNNRYSIEPRFGIRWVFTNNKTVSFGYGLHSQMVPMQWYFAQTRTESGDYLNLNEDLDFIKSHHFVLGYDWNMSEYLRLKVEAYYQKVFNVPVDATNDNSFSLVNINSFTYTYPDKMNNSGNAENYGLELTFERFFDKDYYFLFTTSLYNSKYKGSDNVTHNSAFNGKYVVNALAGKEWKLGKNKSNAKYSKVLLVSGKMTFAGGQRYTPVNVEASQLSGMTVYYDNLAFSEQFKDYFKIDLKVGFRINGLNVTHEIAFDLKNITNHINPLLQRFDVYSGKTVIINQQKFIPIAMYKIQF